MQPYLCVDQSARTGYHNAHAASGQNACTRAFWSFCGVKSGRVLAPAPGLDGHCVVARMLGQYECPTIGWQLGKGESSLMTREKPSISRPVDPGSYQVLRIPYALAKSGERVAPQSGQRRADYACPECHGRVVLRRGEIKVAHFAHYRAPESCRLVGEGWLHVAAKHAVFAAVIRDAEGSSPEVRLLRRCDVCREEKWQALPPRARKVQLEYRLPSGRIADIALLDASDNVLAVVEIEHSHEVGPEKAKDFAKIPWIELSATDALRYPDRWRPVACAGLRPFHCRCKDAARLKTVLRSFALHVDGCPIPARLWRGKPYANVIDDCSQCEFLIGTIDEETPDHAGPGIVLCGGFEGRRGRASTADVDGAKGEQASRRRRVQHSSAKTSRGTS